MKSEGSEVLVTGASGFIGINVVRCLAEKGYNVLGTTRRKGGPGPLGAVELADLLERLEALDERASNVVSFRLFGGLTHQEIAAVLGTSERTVRSDWRHAKAWLKVEMTGSNE